MKTNIFFQKRFWKAAALNLMLATVLIIAIAIYFTAIKYSESRLETTELAKLKITAPEQLLEHKEEIIKMPATITRIYAEWMIETIIFYLLTTIVYTLLYSNSLSILLNNRLQKFTKIKTALKQNLVSFAIIFIIFATITLTTKTTLVAPALQTMFILFAVVLMLVSASQLTKENTLVQHIMRATKAIIPLIKKSIIGTAAFILIIALTIAFLTPTALFYNASTMMQAMAIISTLALIYITWLSGKTLEAIK